MAAAAFLASCVRQSDGRSFFAMERASASVNLQCVTWIKLASRSQCREEWSTCNNGMHIRKRKARL